MEALKPCPFCGGEAHSMQHRSGDEDIFYTTIGCKSCFVSTADFEDAPKDAAASWNTRVPDPRIAELEARAEKAEAERDHLNTLINHPENDDWFKGVEIEAAHQIERWGAEHDAGKSPLDWLWLIGDLAQKATASALAGDTDKAKHHTISTAAALLNWHRRLTGASTAMRPGIDPIERGIT